MKRWLFLTVLLLVPLTLVACSQPTAQVVEKEVTRVVQEEVTRIVQETVVQKETVVEKETVVVEVTPTPEPIVTDIKRGGVMRVGFNNNDFLELDPITWQQWADTLAQDIFYESLVRWDYVSLEPLPALAESWDISDDGLTYTFYLRDGVKFHNGEELEADDVKFSLERIQNPDSGSIHTVLMSPIESVEVVDDLTVVFHLNTPFSPLLSHLPNALKIVNREFVEAEGGRTARVENGTGPFILKEWIPEQIFRIVRNPDYWRLGEDGQPLPYLDEIDIYPYPDDTARVDALISDNVDFMMAVPEMDWQRLEGNPDVNITEDWSLWYSYVGFDNRNPPFNDSRVRQAVAWAIDRDAIANQGLYGAVLPMYGAAVPEWHWAYSRLTPYDHQDLEKAKALLAEAGYPNGFDVTIYSSDEYPSELTLAEMTATYIQEIGINAKVEIVEWGTFLENFIAGNYPMWTCGELPTGDPDDTYYIMHHTGGEWNYGGYSNPALDELLDLGRKTTDLAERKKIYNEVEEILLEDVPLSWSILHRMADAYRLNVRGFQHMGNNRYTSLVETWIDQ